MEPGPPPIEMRPMIKMCQKSLLFRQFQYFPAFFCVQQYTRTAVINNNIDNQEAGPPQFNFCQSMKMNNQAEIKGFYLKVATTGSHITFLKT